MGSVHTGLFPVCSGDYWLKSVLATLHSVQLCSSLLEGSNLFLSLFSGGKTPSSWMSFFKDSAPHCSLGPPCFHWPELSQRHLPKGPNCHITGYYSLSSPRSSPWTGIWMQVVYWERAENISQGVGNVEREKSFSSRKKMYIETATMMEDWSLISQENSGKLCKMLASEWSQAVVWERVIFMHQSWSNDVSF